MAKTKHKTAVQKSEQGSVFVQTSKGVYPMSVLKAAETESKDSSKQLKTQSKWMRDNRLISPPYSPDVLLMLYESNPILFRCVNQLASDVAGLGWNLQLQEDKKENDQEKNRLTSFLNMPNPDDALRAILKPLLIDLGAIGYFGIEVVRNIKGDITALYHIPAHTLLAHTSKKKYCQVRNNKKVWFKTFGIKKDIGYKDGKEGTFSFKTRANEIIFYKNFYPKSDYYGVPNGIAATGSIMGLIALRDYNLAFFENYGVPSAIIILEGEWEDNSNKKVSDFINKEVKGTDNAYKTLVVTQPDKCKFIYTPLGVTVKEASFKLYEQARRDDILIAYSMPPERIGIRVTGALGSNVAAEATKIYVQGVVEPLQRDIEDILNNKILSTDIYKFKFEDIDTRDVIALTEMHNKRIEHGTMTPNEARNEAGLKPYKDGDKFFIISSLLEVGEPNDDLSKGE